jgi:hypothetical protein
MVAYYPRAENAHGEEVAAQASVSAQKAGDGLVAVFLTMSQLGGESEERHWLTIPSDDVPCRRIERYRG